MPFGDTPAFDRGIDRGVMMPVGELITSAISNKGNPTGFGQDNTFRVQNAQEVRIVDNKGNVLFSGIGPDAARQAVAIGQSISDEKGNKAGWTIQTGERTINTDGSVGPMRYYDVANEKVNKSVLGKIADVALPVVGGILAGPLGAAAGSAASSVAQGRGIEDVLLRAAIAGGTSALIPGGPSPADTVAQTAGQTAGQAATQAVSQAATQAATQAAGDIVVNAIVPSLLSQAASGAVGGLASSIVPSFFDSAQLSNVPPAQTQPTPVEPAPVAYTSPPEEIIATAIRQPDVSNLFPAVTGGVSNTLLDQIINQPAQATQTAQPAEEQPLEAGPEIVATAPTGPQIPVVPPLIPDVAPLEKFTPTEEILKDVAMGPENKSLLDRLTANMGLTDYLTAASLLGSAIGGGGGRGATAMPYTSPFGAGVGFGTGRDYRVNPNISDYERYGFGPEATFFAPGYSQLVSGAAGAPAATTMGPQGAMVNPQYVPLI